MLADHAAIVQRDVAAVCTCFNWLVLLYLLVCVGLLIAYAPEEVMLDAAKNQVAGSSAAYIVAYVFAIIGVGVGLFYLVMLEVRRRRGH